MLDYADVIILRAAAGVRGVGAAGVEVAGLQRHVVPEAEAGEAREEDEPRHGGWHPDTSHWVTGA